jgi:hypothetical protein
MPHRLAYLEQKHPMNVRLLTFIAVAAFTFARGPAAAEPAKPVKAPLKITPGKVIVPTDAMRRIWGELVSVDLATRTGTFRKEGTDEIMPFTVMPYAELLHHAAFGDLDDYRIGERAIFRMHENDAGRWVWLTYIQDEMNFLNGHKEYYHVDTIDADKGTLTVTDANFDKSYIRTPGILLETDAETRYWKDAKPAKFADIRLGDKLRTKTHGAGQGTRRICWEVFLDEPSLVAFQDEQKAVHARRLAERGAPGYVDVLEGTKLELTIFQEGGEYVKPLKPGSPVEVAQAGVDRKPSGQRVAGTIAAVKPMGKLTMLSITLDAPSTALPVGGVARVWTRQ